MTLFIAACVSLGVLLMLLPWIADLYRRGDELGAVLFTVIFLCLLWLVGLFMKITEKGLPRS